MILPVPALLLLMMISLLIWILSQFRNNVITRVLSGTSLAAIIAISLFFVVVFWTDYDRIHHLEYQEYVPKADSFLVASQYAIIYWGKTNGTIRSYAPIQKQFVWKQESIEFPKQIVIFEAKGSVRATEKYHELRDSLKEISAEKLIEFSHECVQNNEVRQPLNFVGCKITEDFRYFDHQIRALQFRPAVRFRWAGPVYEGRFSIKEHIKESG